MQCASDQTNKHTQTHQLTSKQATDQANTQTNKPTSQHFNQQLTIQVNIWILVSTAVRRFTCNYILCKIAYLFILYYYLQVNRLTAVETKIQMFTWLLDCWLKCWLVGLFVCVFAWSVACLLVSWCVCVWLFGWLRIACVFASLLMCLFVHMVACLVACSEYSKAELRWNRLLVC